MLPLLFSLLTLSANQAASLETVSFPTADGGTVFADVAGQGDHVVVLAHGGRFTKESWAKQIPPLIGAGFRVIAIDFRGRGQSKGPGEADDPYEGVHFDVLAAVEFARNSGATTVSVVGGSFGAWAATSAAVAKPGAIDRLVLLAGGASEPEQLEGRKLFIIARDDPSASGKPRLLAFRDQFERTPEPKQLVVLDGSEHAQFLFDTDRAEQLTRTIIGFLSEP